MHEEIVNVPSSFSFSLLLFIFYYFTCSATVSQIVKGNVVQRISRMWTKSRLTITFDPILARKEFSFSFFFFFLSFSSHSARTARKQNIPGSSGRNLKIHFAVDEIFLNDAIPFHSVHVTNPFLHDPSRKSAGRATNGKTRHFGVAGGF